MVNKKPWSYEIIEQHMPRKQFEDTVNICLKHKFVYISASKCASSTIKCYLQKKAFQGSPYDIIDVDNKRVSPFISPYQLPPQMVVEIFNSEEFKKVAFVRGPFERLLSNYIHKMRRDTPPARDFRRRSKIKGAVSFSRFIKFICSQTSYDMNPHWRSLSDCLFFENINYTFIGKVENLSCDLVDLGKHLFGNNYTIQDFFDEVGQPILLQNIDSFTPVNNPLAFDPAKVTQPTKLNEYYDDETVTLVARRYRKDLNNFQYESPTIVGG